jgi:hypothetical protein
MKNEPKIGEIAIEAFNKFQNERKELTASLKKCKDVVINTLGWNMGREAWTIDLKEGKTTKRVLVKEILSHFYILP